MGGSDEASPEDGDGDGSEDEPPSGIRRKTGHGTTGKPGKRLTLEDLQAHFGVSLQVRRALYTRCCWTWRSPAQQSSRVLQCRNRSSGAATVSRTLCCIGASVRRDKMQQHANGDAC